MSLSKRQLADRALKLIGVNTRYSEADSQEIQDALQFLEDWMLSNNAIGRRLGWVQSPGTPDPDQDSGVPDWAIMGVTNSLAMYIAPYFDKPLAPQIMQNAAIGMQTISNRTIEIQPVQYPNRMPRGHANGSPWDWKYYQPSNRIVTGGDYLTDEGDDPITTT